MALDPGNVVQNAIYLSGGTDWPVGFDAWEARARETLDQTAYDYVAGGAGAEETMRANLDAFRRRLLRPRMLVGTAERDPSVDVLGLRSPAPFLLAPIGVLSIVRPEAERAVAGASKSTSVPLVLSEEQADAPAEMVKRFGRDDAQRLSADEAEEQAMVEAVIAVRRALADAGLAPR